MNVDAKLVERLYRKLRYIRRVEEEITRIYPSDKIKSPVHLSIGQEAIAVGVCEALRADDVVAGSYRGHAAYLAKGGDLPAMMAELYGKVTGCARGKGGSMHLVDMSHHVLGMSAVVGTTIPVAVGYALAIKREGTGRVVVSFFGDGATEEGVFYESLNFAALHSLPILFVCENNRYAIHTPQTKRWASADLCGRVSGFGVPARQIPDMDVFAIHSAAQAAVDGLRSGTAGPQLIECICYRWYEHVGVTQDYTAGYRTREELSPWQEGDQVARLGALLEAPVRTRIDGEVDREIEAAVNFAEQSPTPTPDELYADVFAS